MIAFANNYSHFNYVAEGHRSHNSRRFVCHTIIRRVENSSTPFFNFQLLLNYNILLLHLNLPQDFASQGNDSFITTLEIPLLLFTILVIGSATLNTRFSEEEGRME